MSPEVASCNLQLICNWGHKQEKVISLHARLWFYNEIYQKEIGFDSVLINTATKCTFPLFAKFHAVSMKSVFNETRLSNDKHIKDHGKEIWGFISCF